MRRMALIALAVSLCIVWATPAQADGTSARDIQAAVDSYLADSNNTTDTNLVGGPGTAGYDSGFWIRGGDFLLRVNATIQARFEAFDWDDDSEPTGANGGGDLSGFSLPRATLKFSGEAPCNTCYYIELEFGHWGEDALETRRAQTQANTTNLGPVDQSFNYDNTREAWIEWCNCDAFNIRMGQIKTPNTRQLMVPPELQQFVDISLASAFTGQTMSGYTDRNRDHGIMVHGSFGCDNEWSYMLAITNGDGGDSIRNVLDHRTSDGLAISGRLNWAFLDAIGYEEGALRQQSCGWYGELGAWAYIYSDRTDKPHTIQRDSTRYGIDLALGYGGFSFTGAYTLGTDDDIGGAGTEVDYTAYLAQIGYHFVGTAFEIAARLSGYNVETTTTDAGFQEIAFGVNYYLNGHGNKMQLDVSLLEGDDAASVLIWDAYAGYANALTGDDDGAVLLRFQWQLAL